MEFIEKDGAVLLDVCVLPRSSRRGIVGFYDGALKIKLTSPPVDGAANAELITLLAKILGLAKRDVEIVNGETSKNKRIRIKNLSQSKIREVLK